MRWMPKNVIQRGKIIMRSKNGFKIEDSDLSKASGGNTVITGEIKKGRYGNFLATVRHEVRDNGTFLNNFKQKTFMTEDKALNFLNSKVDEYKNSPKNIGEVTVNLNIPEKL